MPREIYFCKIINRWIDHKDLFMSKVILAIAYEAYQFNVFYQLFQKLEGKENTILLSIPPIIYLIRNNMFNFAL